MFCLKILLPVVDKSNVNIEICLSLSLLVWLRLPLTVLCSKLLAIWWLSFRTVTEGPHGLTFTRWGCFGWFLWHKPTELALQLSFLFFSCVCFRPYGPFNSIFFHKLSQQLSASTSVLPVFFCLIGPFNCISLYESLPQPWYNPLWLTGFRAPTK